MKPAHVITAVLALGIAAMAYQCTFPAPLPYVSGKPILVKAEWDANLARIHADAALEDADPRQ